MPTMIEQGDGGAIVLTSSVAGLIGVGSDDPGALGYMAAKHGIVGLMRLYANLFAQHSIRVNSVHPAGVDTPMINNEVTRQWLGSHRGQDTAGDGQRVAGAGAAAGGHRQRGRVAGVRRGALCDRGGVAGRRRIRQQALMARNPAAQTAFGPMVQAAIEQYEPPERRLVDDDLALSILPAGQRALVRAMRWPLLRRLTISAGERAVPRLVGARSRAVSASSTTSSTKRCRTSTPSSTSARAWTPGPTASRGDPISRCSRSTSPVNIARKKAAVQRAIGAVPAVGSLGALGL